MALVFEWSLVLLSVTVHLSACIILLHFTRKFYQFRHSQAIQKRHPLLVYCFVFLDMLYSGVGQSFFLLSLLYDENHELDLKALNSENAGTDRYYGDIFQLISLIIYSFTIHGILVIFITRSWIIYFNLKWVIQTKKSEWTVHINNEQIASFWFLKHRNDFGSYKKILTISLSYYISETVLLLIIMLFFPRAILELIDPLLFVLEITILTIVWFKIPSFYDVFAIKEEQKYALIVGLIGLIIMIIWVIAINNIHSIILLVSFETFFAVLWGIIGYFSVGYILRDKYKYLLSGSDLDKLDSFSIPENGVSRSLKNTLNDKYLVDEFFNHLGNEFSVELLLAFIEFVQFKTLMKNDSVLMMDIDDLINDENYIDVEYIINSKVPLSDIVHTKHVNVSNPIQKYLLIAKDLSQKYVDSSSEFEINISYEARMTINYVSNINILSNQEKQMLYSLLDVATNTVYRLMSFSHKRFVTKDEIKKYYANLKL